MDSKIVDHVLSKYKKIILDEYKKEVSPHASTDQDLKNLINTGFLEMKSKGKFFCFSCGLSMRTTLDKLKTKPHCRFCKNKFTI